MRQLINGHWNTDTPSASAFKREPAQFRNWVTQDGTAGLSGRGGFKAEAGRYHLYASLACPWSHRTLIFRALKGLDALIGVSVTHWHLGEEGWRFEPAPGVVPDTVNGAQYIRDLYVRADSRYSGRTTIPVLWDRETDTIVSNESADIIRMLNSAFDRVGARDGDYYPADRRPEIDVLNERIYTAVNDGVYRAGFATDQRAYEASVRTLFETLDDLERRLSRRRYLLGPQMTEPDWRLFATLLRFDTVYFGHFKCNLRRLVDYPNLWAYTRDLYQQPGIAATCNFEHIRRHYYCSHVRLNPSGIVPLGPQLDFACAHGRDALAPRQLYAASGQRQEVI